MLLFFPVPVENVEKAKEVLMLYKDLIVEIKVSRSGSVINVYAHYTEEIPTRFFYVLLKKEVCEKKNSNIISVRKALSRVKLGKYGICEECGQMIDTSRLMIYPEATLCAKDAAKKEQ